MSNFSIHETTHRSDSDLDQSLASKVRPLTLYLGSSHLLYGQNFHEKWHQVLGARAFFVGARARNRVKSEPEQELAKGRI